MDKTKLRDKFFKECVDNPSQSMSGQVVGLEARPRVNLTPHNLFEWFWKEITPQVEQSHTKEEEPKEGDILVLEEDILNIDGSVFVKSGEYEIINEGTFKYGKFHANLTTCIESGVKHRID